MTRLAAIVRLLHDRDPFPSMVMVDTQTVRGGRYGSTFHEAGGRGGRTIGTKRTILVSDPGPAARRPRGLRSAARRRRRPGAPARPTAGPAERKHLALDIKAPPPGMSGFVPIRPLHRIEHAFAQLGRWRRLSRCYEGSEASARAWLEVASVGYLAWRAAA